MSQQYLVADALNINAMESRAKLCARFITILSPLIFCSTDPLFGRHTFILSFVVNHEAAPLLTCCKT